MRRRLRVAAHTPRRPPTRRSGAEPRFRRLTPEGPPPGPRVGTSVAQRAIVESGQTEPLGPELREAEITLEHALTEACASPPASKADTGELIEVEEMLQIASEAAKRAISLRRRRRAERNERAARWAMGDAEAAASVGTTHRAFVDARAIWWDVFAVYPEARPSQHSQLKGTFQQGWLCFDSGTEKRRLS